MVFEKINFYIDKSVSNDNKNYGRFIIEPLERGFGNTIGNALRRVLLSSLTGASIFAVEIDKIPHEFKEIPGVVEDAMTIVLNLKKLVLDFGVEDGEIKKLEINKKGVGVVYAKDIVCPDLVKVVNPDLEIAHLSTDDKFHMVLFAKVGRGYVTAEMNKQNNEPKIGRIYTDSNYSPILNVSYEVQTNNVKHGFEKLILNVWTNGSIKPQDAVSSASNILISHFSQFTDLNKNIKFENKKTNEVKKNIDDISFKEIFSTSLINSLKRRGIENINDLIQKTQKELESKKISEKNIVEINDKLKEIGLSLRE